MMSVTPSRSDWMDNERKKNIWVSYLAPESKPHTEGRFVHMSHIGKSWGNPMFKSSDNQESTDGPFFQFLNLQLLISIFSLKYNHNKSILRQSEWAYVCERGQLVLSSKCVQLYDSLHRSSSLAGSYRVMGKLDSGARSWLILILSWEYWKQGRRIHPGWTDSPLQGSNHKITQSRYLLHIFGQWE